MMKPSWLDEICEKCGGAMCDVCGECPGECCDCQCEFIIKGIYIQNPPTFQGKVGVNEC